MSNEKSSEFRDLARDIARVILVHSWEETQVKDVLLYGSTLLSSAPRDIDLLILHSQGTGLANYTTTLSKFTDGEIASGATIHYYSPNGILHQLGYNGEEDSVHSRVLDLFRERGMLRKEDHHTFIPPTIDKVLDLHVLTTLTITDPGFMGERHIDFYRQYIERVRQKAIRESGSDRTFFHRIFTQGKLYDPKSGDFTASFEDSYPGKLDLFPSCQ